MLGPPGPGHQRAEDSEWILPNSGDVEEGHVDVHGADVRGVVAGEEARDE